MQQITNIINGLLYNNIPYKVYCKDLKEVQSKCPSCEIKEVSGNYNMLFLKDNQFTAICTNGKYYLLTTN